MRGNMLSDFRAGYDGDLVDNAARSGGGTRLRGRLSGRFRMPARPRAVDPVSGRRPKASAERSRGKAVSARSALCCRWVTTRRMGENAPLFGCRFVIP
jgi:hypothetical protein